MMSALLAAEPFQFVIGGKGGFGLCGLPGQQVQLCGIACMTGALGPGGFQYGLRGGKVSLLCSQLLCQLPGLLCRTQLLLHGVQLRFGVLQSGSCAFLRGPLAGQQGVQQSKRGVRLGLGTQRGMQCSNPLTTNPEIHITIIRNLPASLFNFIPQSTPRQTKKLQSTALKNICPSGTLSLFPINPAK